jgi:hypothetical protein
MHVAVVFVCDGNCRGRVAQNQKFYEKTKSATLDYCSHVYLFNIFLLEKEKMSTNLDNIVCLIDNILDGSNYMLWSQNMEVF